MNSRLKKFIRHAVGIVVLFSLSLVLLALWNGAIKPFKIVSKSMNPVLAVGDYLLVVETNYDFMDILNLRSKIVTFYDPEEESADPLVKRIIGIQGDIVSIRSGRLWLNGQLETWCHSIIDHSDCEIIVPEGAVFLMGDNRSCSYDSLDFGCLPISKIKGKVAFRYFPFEKIGSI